MSGSPVAKVSKPSSKSKSDSGKSCKSSKSSGGKSSGGWSSSGYESLPMDAEDDQEGYHFNLADPELSDSEDEAEDTEGGTEDDDPPPLVRGARQIEQSPFFGVTVAGIIVANIFAMALQADNPDVRVNVANKEFKLWLRINGFFLAFFVVEIFIRLLAHGCRDFFCNNHGNRWNLFDFAVVMLGLSDFLYRLFCETDDSGGSIFIAVRALRVLRVLRVVRICRHFRKLRLLARALVESVEIVSWILVLISVLLFISAIFTTTLIGQQLDQWPDNERGEVRKYFGTVLRSMLTLFQFLTMDDWNSVDEMIVRRLPHMQLFFFPFIFFGAFVVMSLLTGVMADHMNDVRRLEEIAQRDTTLETIMSQAFDRATAGNTCPGLDRGEFEAVFSDTEVVADLRAFGLRFRKSEAAELFEWFDVDGDNRVSQEELHHGMLHLLEGLTPLQVLKLRRAVRSAHDFVEEHIESPSWTSMWQRGNPCPASAAEEQLLDDADSSIKDLETKVSKFEHQVRSLMAEFGWTGFQTSGQAENGGGHR